MFRRRVIWLSLAMLLAGTLLVLPRMPVNAAGDPRPFVRQAVAIDAPGLAGATLRANERQRPALSNEAFIRPSFRRQMQELRPTIIAAAQRHNRAALSGMSDQEFAEVIAALLYNEQFGWFEEEVRPVRHLTPFYQQLQLQANTAGANLSVWPANLRPSVAAEILQRQIPVPAPTNIITRSITVSGSAIKPKTFHDQSALYAAITQEISQPHMAVEYLAANLERGLFRASFEGVPVTWRVLAAWHNQGIVAPEAIAENPTADSYVRRTSAYLPAAQRLIAHPPACEIGCTLAERLALATEWGR